MAKKVTMVSVASSPSTAPPELEPRPLARPAHFHGVPDEPPDEWCDSIDEAGHFSETIPKIASGSSTGLSRDPRPVLRHPILPSGLLCSSQLRRPVTAILRGLLVNSLTTWGIG